MVDLNGTVLAQFLNFFILVFILAKFAYKPILKVMEDRRQRIANDLASAETARLEAEALRKDYAAQIAAARKEAQSIVEKAVKEAEATSRQQLAEVREQIAQEKERARKELALERQRTMEDLRNDVIALSVAMAGKVIAKDMDSATNAQLIEESIAKLDSKTIGL